MFGLPRVYHRPRNVRLDTLVRLRWLAVFGQLAAVLVVHFGLEFELPLWPCLAVIAVAALANVALRVRFAKTQWLEPERAAWLFGFDVAELAALLFLTGGLENPFSFLLLGPVLISATALPPRMTMLIGVFAVLCATVLVFYHQPLPWDSRASSLELPGNLCRSGSGSRSCWRSAISASTRGKSPKRRGNCPTRWRRPNSSWRASSISRSSTVSRRRRRTNSARRSPPSPSWCAKSNARWNPIRPYAEDVKLLREQAQRCREILGQDHRTAGRRNVRPHAALRADRGGGRAAPQFRRCDRRDAAARPHGGTGRRPQSGDPLRPRQFDRKRGRFRQPARRDPRAMDGGGGRRSPSATTARVSPRRSWTALARPTSPIGGPEPAARKTTRTSSAWVSAFSLPKHYWSGRAPSLRWRTRCRRCTAPPSR